MSTTKPDPRIYIAQGYVQSRFYPPLPEVYGDLAVQALDAYAEDEDAVIPLPEGLYPYPGGAEEDEDGNLTVRAAILLDALRIDAFNGLGDWFDQLLPVLDTDEEE